MHSLTFNGVDLSAYGLVVTKRGLPVKLTADFLQLQEKSYAGTSKYPPKLISLGVSVTASDLATLESYLDSIMAVLNADTDANLILDTLVDRYWLARFSGLDGNLRSPALWQGILDFVCFDPWAYAVVETSSDYGIDEWLDIVSVLGYGEELATVGLPDMVIEVAPSTAQVRPLYTLVADRDLVDAFVLLRNYNTGEELTWEGTLLCGKVLEIDTEHWIVEIDGEPSMETVEGQFPTLMPGTNHLTVLGFSGTMNIRYRARYI